MEAKTYIEMQEQFAEYLTVRQLRKTEERFAIFKQICAFTGHFDMCMLSECMRVENFHVSKATLYNTLDVLVDAGLVVRHQLVSQSAQYELRALADTHLHLICTRCGAIRELRNSTLKMDVGVMKIARFTPEFYCMYIYGLCSKCKYKQQKLNR